MECVAWIKRWSATAGERLSDTAVSLHAELGGSASLRAKNWKFIASYVLA